MLAKAQTFSHYKHAHTNKFLIGITPYGAISFISQGYGGRASDKVVTEASGFLDNLLPGDIVLADRGFNIKESVEMKHAKFKMPSKTNGRCQLAAKDVEDTRKIAHLTIHVERVIGGLRNKFRIITDTVPIKFLVCYEGLRLTLLDKIVRVCCILHNMCPSVIKHKPNNPTVLED